MHTIELFPGVIIIHSGETVLSFSFNAIQGLDDKEIIDICRWFAAHHYDLDAIAFYAEYGDGNGNFDSEHVPYLAKSAQDQTIKQLAQNAIESYSNRIRYSPLKQSLSDGYIYLLKSGKHYKIGASKNTDKRMTQLATLPPFDLELVFTIKTDNMFALEKKLHDLFAEKRQNGEWFELNTEDIEYIKEIASQNEGK